MEEEYYRLAEKGIRFITHLDPDYPSRLLSLYDFPAALYVKGDLPKEDEPAAAIIGARECSAYGRQTAEHMAKELAEAGVTIISGWPGESMEPDIKALWMEVEKPLQFWAAA
mgnify:CR=1 FL=1